MPIVAPVALMLMRFLLARCSQRYWSPNEKYEGRRITSRDDVPDDNILAPQELEKALSALKVGDPLSIGRCPKYHRTAVCDRAV